MSTLAMRSCSSVRGRSFRYYAQVLSLGRHDGLVQAVGADDAPRRAILTGRAAAFVKEQVVRSTVRSLRLAGR